MVVAVVAGLILVAAPLYLWKRPVAEAETVPAQEEAADAGVTDATAAPSVVASKPPGVKLSPFRTIRCVKHGPGKTPPVECDHLPFFESALKDAIRKHAALGPKHRAGAVVSIVMDVDFHRRKLKIFRGKSSTVPKSSTKQLFRRLRAAMPEPRWDSIPHRHYMYVVYLKATYPPSVTF